MNHLFLTKFREKMPLLVPNLYKFNSPLKHYPFYIELHIKEEKNCVAFGQEDDFT